MSSHVPPQADRLSVVATVVDAIAAGCDTADSIADGIGMSGRQGSYYPQAAETLGLVQRNAGTSPATWSLTRDGEAFADANTRDRIVDLVDRLAEFAELDTITRTGGEELLAEQYLAAGYSPDTAHRRVQTMRAWAEFLLLDTDAQEQTLAGAKKDTATFAPAAAKALATARAAARAALTKGTQAIVGDVCTTCFTAKSLTGECANCD